MWYIETRGSWREMGRQYGEALREPLSQAIELLLPWLGQNPQRATVGASRLRKILQKHCPEVSEETAGMAEGANLPLDTVTSMRFLGEIGIAAELGCSAVFLADSDQGPLLGRNCDIESDPSVQVQVCRTSRPRDAAATVLITYAGMLAGGGMNEHGLGIGGTSAFTAHRGAAQDALPNTLAFHLALHHCRDVPSAQQALSAHAWFGKSSVSLLGDASGRSTLMELIPFDKPVFVPRSTDRDWQHCTNQYVRSVDLIYTKGEYGDRAPYLQNSYARYGRIAHRLGDNPMPRTVENLHGLMTDIAAPGMCIPEKDLHLHTAYMTIFDLRRRRLLLADGHPASAQLKEIVL